jgi:hypothetical protein
VRCVTYCCSSLAIGLTSLGWGTAAIAAEVPHKPPMAKEPGPLSIGPWLAAEPESVHSQAAEGVAREELRAEGNSAASAINLEASALQLELSDDPTQAVNSCQYQNLTGEPQPLPRPPVKRQTASSQADLARAAQNPIASLISVPFQNNTNFGVGRLRSHQQHPQRAAGHSRPLSENLTLVNRTIIPISYQPELAPGLDSAFGLGDINYTGFFVPTTTGNFTWGVGPSILLPTATDTVLGTGKWSVGPAAVGLVTQGPIVAGALVSQLWSFAGDSNRDDVNLFTLQPFFNYNFDGGWYLSTSPIITANWAGQGEQWTVPLGGGGGRVFNIGSQPVNASLAAYWNAVKARGCRRLDVTGAIDVAISLTSRLRRAGKERGGHSRPGLPSLHRSLVRNHGSSLSQWMTGKPSFWLRQRALGRWMRKLCNGKD